jgi:type III secretory pathway component EscR
MKSLFLNENSNEEIIEEKKSEEDLHEYQKMFKEKLKAKGYNKLSDLVDNASDEEKKEFFEMIDKEWKSEEEKKKD